jgi:hypothetical protein
MVSAGLIKDRSINRRENRLDETASTSGLILLCAASMFRTERSSAGRGSNQAEHHLMKLTTPAVALLTAATLSSAIAAAQVSPGNRALPCVARVVYSEELPFAPIGSWLVRAILEITPPNGIAYQMTLQDYMPWQGPPPRRGQVFRLLCDPANPGDLHLISRPGGLPAAF